MAAKRSLDNRQVNTYLNGAAGSNSKATELMQRGRMGRAQ